MRAASGESIQGNRSTLIIDDYDFSVERNVGYSPTLNALWPCHNIYNRAEQVGVNP